MVVKLDEFNKHMNYRYKLNSTPIEKLVILDSIGNKIVANTEDIEHWKYCGLNNIDFIKHLIEKK